MAISVQLDAAGLRALCRNWRQKGESIAFVPTMGALHQGHLSLVEKAKHTCERVVVSIFVNPTQFGPNEDFAKYPRQLSEDLKKLEKLEVKVDAVYTPSAAEMYPEGFSTYVTNDRMSKVLCGAYRQGHFDGVLTVVCKLLNIVQADTAIFGKKDYQQFLLIRKMVEDLNMPIEILGADTVREADGLAMSSRNQRLSAQQRQWAPRLFEGMQKLKRRVEGGEKQTQALISDFVEGFKDTPIEIQYAELRYLRNLDLIEEKIDDEAILAVAAFLGDVRLIDNLELK